jgi:uncharacterized protein (TIGR02145 family)
MPPTATWSDKTKMANDPCPAGYRIPTEAQWVGVIANNSRTAIGTWEVAATNYSFGMKFGNKLVLPAAGYRRYNDGLLVNRGSNGYYWSSRDTATLAPGTSYSETAMPAPATRTARRDILCGV